MGEEIPFHYTRKNLNDESDGCQPCLQESNNGMTAVVTTSLINTNREMPDGRRGLLREYCVKRVIWHFYSSYIHIHTHNNI